jgi:hypothetical protein
MGAGWVVIWEMDSGVIERLRVTPASRLALLLGTVLRDVVMFAVPAVIMIAIAIPFGFHARWGRACPAARAAGRASPRAVRPARPPWASG